jgi:acyl-CoA-binding protein
MNLNREQIARVFTMYIGCSCHDVYNDRVGEFSGLYVVNNEYYVQHKIGWTLRQDEIKLLLAPLSSITDEDAIEVVRLCGMPKNAEVLKVIKTPEHVEVEYRWKNKPAELNTKDGYSYSAIASGLRGDNKWEVREYLIQKGYAVPLFIEPNHPDNGKTAIELGLAIDKTKPKQP